jgi:hypothetical protein
MHMQMYFSFNTRAIEQPNRHNGASVMEMEEDEDPNKGGTALLCAASYYPDDEIMAAGSDEEAEEKAEGQGQPDEKAEGKVDEEAEEVEEKLELDDDDEEEEDEEEDDGKDEKEEKTEQEKLSEFVKTYVAEERIVRGFRWPAWKRSVLQAALIKAGIKTAEGDVINRMRKYAGERVEV